MQDKYNPAEIEPKWQRIWEESGCFAAEASHDKPKYYTLIEFPYPSGNGLHVGHPRSNTALDIISRKRRMEGYNVLFPMGYDAFGLPTENYALATGIHPAEVTRANVEKFRAQLKKLGFSFDYSREVNTTDPAYYKWTQWIFLKLFQAGLAYKTEMPINFCNSCKVGLANEEVKDGVCERCGGEVVRRVKSQWMLKITDYAEKLLDGLDGVDFIERVKTQQRNWIGKSEGAEVRFEIAGQARNDEKGMECQGDGSIDTVNPQSVNTNCPPDTNAAELLVYTTRPDTLFGATYMVIAPEHPLVDALAEHIENLDDVRAYIEAASHKSDFERSELNKNKTGVPLLGITAINPATGQPIPVWISDYVLMGYGTGAIMAVPGHDDRDWAFARAFGLSIVEVVSGGDIEQAAYTDCDDGVMVNSGFLNGMQVPAAIAAMTEWLAERGLGEKKVNFKLRDWVFSRQRYWGEPIPLVNCPTCGWVPLPESQLPLRLPEIENFYPADDGSSPLTRATDWVRTACPACGGPAQRETDTMPQWAGSSWYFLRYLSPFDDKAFAEKSELAYWLPVDWYNGGMEHTTLHLLYSRFWHRFLYDIGQVPT
ncbi:MAG: leucine--tRNA ligase, partial [Clostridiales bacterium]|nr:leucine--tRNA ligase [Clostridiales bacterium]